MRKDMDLERPLGLIMSRSLKLAPEQSDESIELTTERRMRARLREERRRWLRPSHPCFLLHTRRFRMHRAARRCDDIRDELDDATAARLAENISRSVNEPAVNHRIIQSEHTDRSTPTNAART
jgi:hypothetical protein